jgi:hypothetical protein
MSGYIGTQPVPQATQHRESFTATASQTTFATVGYTPQFVDVYLNGIHLLDTVDYTATNSSDVVLTTGAAASDVVEIISYTPFEVANQTFTGTTTVDVLTATGAFTSVGIDDNATSTAITIDASENVGIGATTVDSQLHIEKSEVTSYNGSATDGQLSVGATAFIQQTGGSNTALSQIVFQPRSGYGYNRIVSSGGSAPYMAITTNNAERMRINSLGGVIAGSSDPSFNGAVAGDVVTTGGLNLNGMQVVKSKYITLTTSTQDILLCANRATYKITVSACDTSTGVFRGSQTAFLSVSNDYAGQGTTLTNVSGNLVLGWKAGSGYGTNSRTLTARSTSSTANAWVITVEIQSNYARSTEGTGVGSSQFLI